jgi:alpha-glucoside transport system permease protein
MQVFRKVIVPSILPTIAVVTTYMVINAMKVFDIVFVQPASAEVNGTVVIAERMIRWAFLNRDNGKGAAIAVVLFIAVVPVLIWNVKRFREEEMTR